MRKNKDYKSIQETKLISLDTPYRSLIISYPGHREYFKYVDGQLEEYDITYCNGTKIVLTKEEMEALENFNTTQQE